MRACLVLALAAGCYHPNITDGTIYCSQDSARKCPDGFACGNDGICRVHPVTSPYGDGKIPTPDLTGRTGTMLLHTDTGAITIGAEEIVKGSATPYILPQVRGPKVTVWSFTSLTIPAGLVVTTSGDSRAVAVLAATESLTVNGDIHLAGKGGVNGSPYFPGSDSPATDTGGGGGAMMPGDGGGGGGGNARAGQGGTGTMPGSGGVAYDVSEPAVVYFGQGGGGGGGTDGFPGYGGVGAGSVALLAPSVELAGAIDAHGEDGEAATGAAAGGGGGGSGGTILVSGDTIKFDSGCAMNAVGGTAGAGAGSGGNGGDGSPGRILLASGNFSGACTISPSGETRLPSALKAFPVTH
jgi:hypothetical protein